MSRAWEACQNLTFRKGTEVVTAVSEHQAYLTALSRVSNSYNTPFFLFASDYPCN